MVIGARHIGQPRRLPAIQGAAKKMTQHIKCDNSVTLENFCANFCVFV